MRADEYTLDEVLGGRLRFFQRKKGYRFSIDSLILGNFVGLNPKEKALEIGSGCGVVSIMVGTRHPDSLILGIEVQGELYRLSKINRIINGTDNVFFINSDVRDSKLIFSPGSFDAIFLNPPYREVRGGRTPPDAEKLLAKHQILLAPHEISKVASYLLKNRGKLYIIYEPRRMLDLIHELSERSINPSFMVPIFSENRWEADIVFLEAEKGTKRELKVVGPFSLYDGKGERTPFHLEVSLRLFPSGTRPWKEKQIWTTPKGKP